MNILINTVGNFRITHYERAETLIAEGLAKAWVEKNAFYYGADNLAGLKANLLIWLEDQYACGVARTIDMEIEPAKFMFVDSALQCRLTIFLKRDGALLMHVEEPIDSCVRHKEFEKKDKP